MKSLIATLMLVASSFQASSLHDTTEIVGTWQGTSTCTDRVAAPACNDEVIVYEMSTGASRGVVHQKAFKIVNGQRDLMGEMDFAYSADDHCWRSEFNSPRLTSVWCLAVTGSTISGSAWLMPGRKVVRAVKAQKQ